jgi:hypothetical protein
LLQSWTPTRFPTCWNFLISPLAAPSSPRLISAKAYHEIPVHPDDICKTAICTPFGLFEYTGMPFGLRNVGNTFQRKIDRVKSQLEFCFAFQDNLEVASKENIQHRLHLRQVFAFSDPRPLTFWATESPPVASHLALHMSWRCWISLQGFLGLLNFYCHFFPMVARTLQPLKNTLKGNRKEADLLEWSDNMETAFTSSKKSLQHT